MKQRVIILGGGESGTGAAILAAKKGHDVLLSEKGTIKDIYKAELDKRNIRYEEGMHSTDEILKADIVVKSPGIPDKSELIIKINELKIPIISEIEYAGTYSNAYHICITGTDGKTTTTSLIYHMMKKAGMNVGLAGNIGKSFAWQVAENDFEYYVLEISSFQLDGMYKFKADIAILTNINPDHLDRYDYDFDKYAKSKLRILQNQTASDYFIYCADDKNTLDRLPYINIKATQYPFSYFHPTIPGAYKNGDQLTINLKPNKPINMNFSELSLKGRHNAYNSMAAGIVGDALGIRNEIVRESLGDFVNIEHRLENLGKVGGIEFINDSKATNVNAAWYALESMENPVVWIAGGQDKGNDYEKLKPMVKEKVKYIVSLGVDNRKIHEAFANDVEMIINSTTMSEAVHIAYKLAAKGDSVLLSPACASFDIFENYEDRGRQFKKAVKNL